MKKTILFSLLMLSISALRATEPTSFWSTASNNAFIAANTATIIFALKNLTSDSDTDNDLRHSSRAILYYYVPNVLINRYQKTINGATASGILAEQAGIILATSWLGYTLYKFTKAKNNQPAAGQPIPVQGYGQNDYNQRP